MKTKLNITIKRAYEAPSANDGYRILVDRLWPRGIKKEELHIDEWDKDIAPSAALRKWYGHQPERFNEFEQRYEKELKQQSAELKRIRHMAQEKHITLLYGAKDELLNQAVVLQKVLLKKE